ncbi:MAG: ribonuclease P protein component [Chloroflexota bacterium]
MRKPWSLTRREQFDKVFRHGRAVHGALTSVRALPNGQANSRLGLVVGKRVGGAVQRNRAKRLIREAINVRALPAGWDVVVTARPGIHSAKYTDVEREVRGLLVRTGVLGPRDDDTGLHHSRISKDHI